MKLKLLIVFLCAGFAVLIQAFPAFSIDRVVPHPSFQPPIFTPPSVAAPSVSPPASKADRVKTPTNKHDRAVPKHDSYPYYPYPYPYYNPYYNDPYDYDDAFFDGYEAGVAASGAPGGMAATAMSAEGSELRKTRNFHRFYVGLRGGISSLNNVVDLTDYHGGLYGDYTFYDYVGFWEASVGFYVTKNLRFEGGYTGFSEMKDKQDDYYIQRNFGSGFEDSDYVNRINLSLWMVNVLYDFDSFGTSAPYIGFGVGQAKVKDVRTVESRVTSSMDYEGYDTSRDWAFQLQLGSAFQIVDHLDFDLNFKMFYVAHDSSIYGFALGAGLRYSF